MVTPGARVVTRGAGVVTHGAGVVTPGAGVVTRGAGVVTPGAGVVTRGARGRSHAAGGRALRPAVGRSRRKNGAPGPCLLCSPLTDTGGVGLVGVAEGAPPNHFRISSELRSSTHCCGHSPSRRLPALLTKGSRPPGPYSIPRTYWPQRRILLSQKSVSPACSVVWTVATPLAGE